MSRRPAPALPRARLLATLLLLVLPLAVAACGDSPQPAVPTPTTIAGSTAGAATPTTAPQASAGTPLPTIPANMPPTTTLRIDNFSYVQEGDHVTVVGAVTNAGPAVLGRIELIGAAKDAGGATIGEGDAVLLTYVELWPGKSAPFRMQIGGLPAEAASVEVTGQAENKAPSADNALANAIEVGNTDLYWEEGSVPILSGLVRNGGQRPAADVDVAVIGYDAAGKVVNVGRESVVLDYLPGGGVAPFRVAMYEFAEVAKVDTLVIASGGSERAPSGLEIGEFTHYADGSQVEVIGVIRNSGAITLEHVHVAVYAEDENGAVVGVAEDSYLDATEVNVPPGATAPFRASMDLGEERVRQVKVVGEADQFSADDFNFSVPAQLSVSGVEIAEDNKVTGEVKNDGATPANSIQLRVAGYDAAGKLVNVGRGQLDDVDVLAPGQTAGFAIFLHRSDVVVDRVEVFVTGLERQE